MKLRDIKEELKFKGILSTQATDWLINAYTDALARIVELEYNYAQLHEERHGTD